ncbi:hypothetical protein Tco_0929787 [Tanacetum coccineum]
MVEKKFFDEGVLRCSRLKNRCVNLELKLQHQKESFLNNKSLNNQDAPEIQEFFNINEWQAKLNAKDVSIANLRKHIESLKVLKNRDAHIDYIKNTQENVDILWELVKHARALRPLDSDLDSSYKYAKRIQEMLVYVTTTCPSLTKPSEKLVAITPLNKNRKVRFTFTRVVPLKETTSKLVITQNPAIKVYSMRPKVIESIGSSSKSKILESRISNNSKPNQYWGSNASNVPSSSVVDFGLSKLFSSTVRFGNDQIAKIMGYGDYQMGNVMISQVYYVEGLGHNLFSVSQFCDSNVEVGNPKANDWLLGRVTHLRAQIDLREAVEKIGRPRFKMRASPLSPHRTSTSSTLKLQV